MLFFLFALLQGIDGIHVCAALTTSYNMVNSETGQIQFLFPFDTENNKAIVKRISKVKYQFAIVLPFLPKNGVGQLFPRPIAPQGMGVSGPCTQWDWTQWDWDTEGLGCNGTGTQWGWDIMGLDTMGLGYSGTGAQWD